jgi:excisionase family DNA binding protein
VDSLETSGSEPDDIPSLSVRDIAAYTGLSYHAVLRAIHRSELRAYKLCGRVRLCRCDVRAWVEASLIQLEENRVETPPPGRGSLEALRALERRQQ